ncbi:hypothetical protein PAPYR_6440 [Paratrimastix pyriformis]|uniref:Uncharacterized protein n=1 Tax=Paratrimastix pyriformis TaxID=342808 RepID=A0ABQ8UF94_9EUKA|nr:hypothetical protein PAPYR_6440 [Paratrimastix pyriformis]
MSTKPVIPVILLCALPASGKSESRAFLKSLDPRDLRENFCIGENVQLDDYPYVHMMRQFDLALEKLHQPRIFYKSDLECFRDGFEWGTLIELLNEDYQDLVTRKMTPLEHPTQWLMTRIDRARCILHLRPYFVGMTDEVKAGLAHELDEECAGVIREKNAGIPDTLEGKTVVIEFARGGPEGSNYPIAQPQGYQYSLSLLSRDILSNAAMLYIWVTPEESRRKNQARAKPNGDGSILFHGVPEKVMRDDYGCDDIDYLLRISDRPNTLKVEVAPFHTYYVPVGRFDNRHDLTTFARGDPKTWPQEAVTSIRGAMTAAFTGLLAQFHELHGKH